MALLPSLEKYLKSLNSTLADLKAKNYKMTTLNMRESADKNSRAFFSDVESYQDVVITDNEIISGKFPLCLRIYHPNPQKALPVNVYFHGGGFVIGSVPQCDNICKRLAKLTNHVVVSVEYRLAPEFPYPACVEDAKTSISGIFDLLCGLKINHRRDGLTLSGDSAGAGICIMVSMDKEFVITHHVKNQVLFYPVADYNLNTNSMVEFGDGYYLTRDTMAWFLDYLFQNNEDLHKLSPLNQTYYLEMPNTLVFVAENDPLKDGGLQYYEKIRNIASKSQFVHVDGVIHSFLKFEDLHKQKCLDVYETVNKFLNDV